MNDIFNIINITADNETELRRALQNAIQSNFVDYFNSNIKITNRKCPNIKFNFSTQANSLDITYDNADLGVSQTITSLTYSPYVSKIAYKSYYDESYDLSKYTTAFRYKYTMLLALLFDVNIVGFSIISPSDLELVNVTDKNGYSLYTVKSDTNTNNVVMDEVNNVNTTNFNVDDSSITFPEHIKIQSGIINNKNSYYEIAYIDLEDINSLKYLPCIEGKCYDIKFDMYDDGTFSSSNLLTYTLDSQLKGKYSSINISNINDNENNSLLTLPKLLINESNILGYTCDIYDCPSLSVPSTYTENSYNAGDIITLNDSNYLIVDNNTMIKLFNCEITSSNYNGTYDSKTHFISINCPTDSKIYYTFDNNDEESWTLLTDINNPTFTEEQNLLGVCRNVGNWQINYRVIVNVPTINYLGNIVTKKVNYYGSSFVNITPADIYGYYVVNTNLQFDGKSHSVIVYVDETYRVEYSTDKNVWYNTPITYKNVGTYTIYYRISKDNYNTIEGQATLTIQPASSTGTVPPIAGDIVNDCVVLNTVNYTSGITRNIWYYVQNEKTILVAERKNTVNTSSWTKYDTNYEKYTSSLLYLGNINISPSKCYILVFEYPKYSLMNKNNKVVNEDIIKIVATSTKDSSKSILVTDAQYGFLCVDTPMTESPWKTNYTSHGDHYFSSSYGRSVLIIDLTDTKYDGLDKLKVQYRRSDSNITSNRQPILTKNCNACLLTCEKVTLKDRKLDLSCYLRVDGTLNSDTVITDYNNEQVSIASSHDIYFPDDYKSGKYSFDYYKYDKYTLPFEIQNEGSYKDYIYSIQSDVSSDKLQLKQGILNHLCINNDNLAPTVTLRHYDSTNKWISTTYPFEMTDEEQSGSGTITFELDLVKE